MSNRFRGEFPFVCRRIKRNQFFNFPPFVHLHHRIIFLSFLSLFSLSLTQKLNTIIIWKFHLSQLKSKHNSFEFFERRTNPWNSFLFNIENWKRERDFDIIISLKNILPPSPKEIKLWFTSRSSTTIERNPRNISLCANWGSFKREGLPLNWFKLAWPRWRGRDEKEKKRIKKEYRSPYRRVESFHDTGAFILLSLPDFSSSAGHHYKFFSMKFSWHAPLGHPYPLSLSCEFDATCCRGAPIRFMIVRLTTFRFESFLPFFLFPPSSSTFYSACPRIGHRVDGTVAPY